VQRKNEMPRILSMDTKYRNTAVKALQKNGKISKAEYKRLFEDKSEYNEEQEALFYDVFNSVIELQSNESVLNLEVIRFPRFSFHDYPFPDNKPISFAHAIFAKKSHFEDVVFGQDIDFEGTTFLGKAYFYDAAFSKKAIFISATFMEKAYFRRVKFMGEASFLSTSFLAKADFRDTVFADEALFRGAVCKDLIQFSGALISSLDLETSRFDDASYLHLHGLDPHNRKPILLSSKNFPNKESARHIKAHFEKQNNITEANNYFVIEQSLYLDELKSEDWWSHKGKIFTVALHKLISNSGTSWIKVFFWIMLFALVVLILHDGIPLDKESILNIPNRAISLINPMNIFRRGLNLYEGHEFWGMIVRVIATYLIYQFMMAFRQDTRRK
jgi:uncharacterized protein YjbI with pentapeptide repeats